MKGTPDVKTTKLSGAGAAAVGAATAVTALLLGSTAAVADETRAAGAFAIKTEGLLRIGPIPSVESDGELVREELIGLGSVGGANEAGLSARLLTAQARAHAAESSVADLDIRGLLRGELVRTYCEDGEGGLELVRGSMLGQDLPPAPVPGEEIDVSPLLSVTFNQQERDDGALTVTGIVLRVLPGADRELGEQLDDEERAALPALDGMFGTRMAGGADTVADVVDQLGALPGVQRPGSGGSGLAVTIGSATCAAEDDDQHGDDRDDENEGEDANENEGEGGTPEAPKPEIVEADLPVTG
jgi:hypothetical protein